MIQRERRLKDQIINAAQVIAFPFILTATLVAATLWFGTLTGEPAQSLAPPRKYAGG